MRPDCAFSLTFAGTVKFTQIKFRLTEGVNFKGAQLKCISCGAGCLFKIKTLPSKGAGKVFREQSEQLNYGPAQAENVHAKGGSNGISAKLHHEEFYRAPLHTQPCRQAKESHGLRSPSLAGGDGSRVCGALEMPPCGSERAGVAVPLLRGDISATGREVAATLLLWRLPAAGPSNGTLQRPGPMAGRAAV